MKKCLIFMVMLVNVLALGFSQTGNSWTVTNTSTWIEAVNGIRSGGNDKTYTITVNGTVSIPGSTESTFGAVTGITVNMEGSGTLSPSNNGAVLNIGAGQTIIVRNITLRGRSDNTSSVVDNNGGTFRMEGSASVTGNTRSGGVWVNGGTFTMQDNASVSGNSRSNRDNGGGVYASGTYTMQGGTVSGNTATYYGGGVYIRGTFNKIGGTVYGEDADANQRNTVVSRIGNALYNSANGGLRNVTAGITMNPDSYGFWLNDGDVVTFPSNFAGTWRRSNFNNTLNLTSNIIKSSSSNYFWVLQRISDNSYTFKRADASNTITITINLTNNYLVISGDSGSGQDNWNGTWIKQR